jgi:hypothetical protein
MLHVSHLRYRAYDKNHVLLQLITVLALNSKSAFVDITMPTSAADDTSTTARSSQFSFASPPSKHQNLSCKSLFHVSAKSLMYFAPPDSVSINISAGDLTLRNGVQYLQDEHSSRHVSRNFVPTSRLCGLENTASEF